MEIHAWYRSLVGCSFITNYTALFWTQLFKGGIFGATPSLVNINSCMGYVVMKCYEHISYPMLTHFWRGYLVVITSWGGFHPLTKFTRFWKPPPTGAVMWKTQPATELVDVFYFSNQVKTFVFFKANLKTMASQWHFFVEPKRFPKRFPGCFVSLITHAQKGFPRPFLAWTLRRRAVSGVTGGFGLGREGRNFYWKDEFWWCFLGSLHGEMWSGFSHVCIYKFLLVN